MREEDVLAQWDEILALLDAYESLLSASQQDTLRLYFRFNLSLGEIAEEKGISRAAIFDALKKGVAKLRHYEESLGLAKKNRCLQSGIEQLESAASLDEAKAVLPILKEAYDDGI